MHDEMNELKRRLEQATSRGPLPETPLDPETAALREGWTALGFMAAHSSRARLGLMVGGIHYRYPGLWIKAATTLDVLSGGRGWLGIGAAWNEEESNGLGFPFPPLAERFEMLEETLRIGHELWTGERGSEGRYEGRHYRATRLLNSPQSISRPRVPIMVGGGGEKKDRDHLEREHVSLEQADARLLSLQRQRAWQLWINMCQLRQQPRYFCQPIRRQ